MKTKEEIEQLAELWNDQQTELEFGKPHNAPNRIKSFVQGYNKCQEDMDDEILDELEKFAIEYEKSMADKKYTKEDLHNLLRARRQLYSHTDENVLKVFINSLNKQD